MLVASTGIEVADQRPFERRRRKPDRREYAPRAASRDRISPPTTGRRRGRDRPQERRAAPPAGPADRHRRNRERRRYSARAASSPRLRAPLGPQIALGRDHADARIGRASRDTRARAVGRGVVDHDQLEARVVLREHARDRARQAVPAIVGRKDDGNVGGLPRRSSPRASRTAPAYSDMGRAFRAATGSISLKRAELQPITPARRRRAPPASRRSAD